MTKSRKRDDIMRAALELLAENGFHGASMAMIAEQAGVGAGTIYRYFESRDVLITELHRDLEERMFPAVMEGYPLQKSIRERFLHLGAAFLRFLIENPRDFRYLEQFQNSPYGVALRRDRLLGNKGDRDVLKELFEEGVAQQVMKDIPLELLFSIAFGPILNVARDHILGFITLDDTLIARTVEACWDGIRR
jgi:AcrR family transcriptional regulator